MTRFFLVPILFGLAGCASSGFDYAELNDAVGARERLAGTTGRPARTDVSALLSRPLTAESSAQIALLNNQGARATLEELGIAQAELASARRFPNPTVEAAMRFDGDDRPDLEVGALIDLTDFLLALPRSDAADAQVRAEKLNAIGSLLDLSFEARRTFFEYQAAQQMLELRRTALQAYSASADAAKRLHEAGNITDLDLANEQSLFEEARLNLQRVETEVATAGERLNAILGLWGRGTEWRVTERLPDLPEREIALSVLERDAVRRSLDLEAAKHRFTAAARRSNTARAAGWLPELKAGVSAEREDEWAVGPAVELEVPLFYQGQGEVGVAQAQMRMQKSIYTDTAVRLRAEARSIAARLAGARDAALHYRDVLLPLKLRVVNETQLRYNAMLIGVFQLLQAKREQVETGAGYVAQLRDYWIARMDAEQLLAGRFRRSTQGSEAPNAVPENGSTAFSRH